MDYEEGVDLIDRYFGDGNDGSLSMSFEDDTFKVTEDSYDNRPGIFTRREYTIPSPDVETLENTLKACYVLSKVRSKDTVRPWVHLDPDSAFCLRDLNLQGRPTLPIDIIFDKSDFSEKVLLSYVYYSVINTIHRETITEKFNGILTFYNGVYCFRSRAFNNPQSNFIILLGAGSYIKHWVNKFYFEDLEALSLIKKVNS